MRVFAPSGVNITANLRVISQADADQDSLHALPGRRAFVTVLSTRNAGSSQFPRIAMPVFMLSLLGFPVFGGAGFLGKWFLLKAALQAPVPQIALAVVGVLSTVISAG